MGKRNILWFFFRSPTNLVFFLDIVDMRYRMKSPCYKEVHSSVFKLFIPSKLFLVFQTVMEEFSLARFLVCIYISHRTTTALEFTIMFSKYTSFQMLHVSHLHFQKESIFRNLMTCHKMVGGSMLIRCLSLFISLIRK